jgi:hypothetical protein
VKVIQHIPSFCEGFEREEHEVSSAAQLLELPFVQSWKEHGPHAEFHQFSVDRNYWANPRQPRDQMHLFMAEYDSGYAWWVVAKLSGEDALEVIKELPEWNPKYERPH